MKLLFENWGVHALVDGQFGSTGKGALAAWLAHKAFERVRFDWVVSNAGPNSGHTFYHGDEKHVLKQLPTFAVATHLLNPNGVAPRVYLSSGAIVDPDVLKAELLKYPAITVYVSPMAAVISLEDKDAEHSGTIAAVAGTRSGTGAVLARKVQRDPSVVARDHFKMVDLMRACPNVTVTSDWYTPKRSRIFMEVSQGFSLGLNQRFYPKVTSRECTVSQALADAGLPPRSVSMTYMSMRTFPIRVGDVDGFSSGEWYADQREVTWKSLGVEPELTTVTQRQRRVATFSMAQLTAALRANDPEWVFLNFMNYLPLHERQDFAERVRKHVSENSSREADLIYGHGPKPEDISVLDQRGKPAQVY